MTIVNFVDTTFRDGHASLWAQAMTTGMMLPVAPLLDQVGYSSMEIMASSMFKKCIREHREEPWDRIRLLSQKITRTPLTMMMHCSVSAFDVTPLSVLNLWMERIAANGINRVQLMEPSNDMAFKVPEAIQFAKNAGMQVALSLVFSLSPRHTDEHYAQKARDAADLHPDVIYLKDPGGLLTPERIRTLVPVILENIKGIPVEIHSHCTTGLAPLCYLEAIRLGIHTVHTAAPPLANGSSQPSVFNIARNARLLGYETNINEEVITTISNHFKVIAKREKLPVGMPVEYDHFQNVHQIPGGVISNLKHQLSLIKMDHRLDEIIEEIIQVRKDLGYPIMVTPFSQFVVSQATINVISGQRYREVSDELIRYTLGYWGEEASLYIEPDIKDLILSRPRAKEIMNSDVVEPSISEVRQKIGGPGISDDELMLLYIMGGDQEIKAMRSSSGQIKTYSDTHNPIVHLIEELARYKDISYINVRKSNITISLK